MTALLFTFMIAGCENKNENENEPEIIKGKGWFSITLTANPSDAGTFVTSHDISEDIKEGKTVSVTPKPALNYYLSGWTGDIEGSEEILDIVMDRDMDIVAEFLPGVYETFQDDSADYFIDDESGRWATNDTAYVMTGSNSNTWTYSVYNYASYDNFEVSVDINIVADTDNNPAGIYFRSQSANLWDGSYWVVLTPDGYWYLMKTSGGSYTFLKYWTTSSDLISGYGNSNNLKAVCSGNTIEVFINGVSQGSFTDDTYSSGYIGLFGFDYSGYKNIFVFDNFSVRSLSAEEKSMTSAGVQTTTCSQTGDPRFH